MQIAQGQTVGKDLRVARCQSDERNHDERPDKQQPNAAAELLSSNGFYVQWHEYPMAHQVCIEEINDIRRWLSGVYT